MNAHLKLIENIPISSDLFDVDKPLGSQAENHRSFGSPVVAIIYESNRRVTDIDE